MAAARLPVCGADSLWLLDHSNHQPSPTLSVMPATYADRKRRVRCWFILARGATPSMAITTVRLGRQGQQQQCRTSQDRSVHLHAGRIWVGLDMHAPASKCVLLGA